MTARTLYEKLCDAHAVCSLEGGEHLLYIDRHLIHEVTSPQAFEGLRAAGRDPWRRDCSLAVPDHGTSTRGTGSYANAFSRQQVEALGSNCGSFEIPLFPLGDVRRGIVHIIGPEQGFVLPGMTVVCGDSHTSTNGALGCLAFGIGTSEVEHVLATQCLPQRKARTMRIAISGTLRAGVDAKDVILAIIGRIGTAGGTGYAIEYAGPVIDAMDMAGRMTVCNMSIEAGARAGLIAVDETTLSYVRGRPFAPAGAMLDQAESYWRTLASDPDAEFGAELALDGSSIKPQVSWGTSPEMVAPVDGRIPDPAAEPDAARSEAMRNALAYMDLEPNTPINSIRPDKIFIGSCSNARLADLRRAADQLRGKHIAPTIRQALVVPGSGLVREQAEREGLDQIFRDAGFEWREAGCSMCLGMNDDIVGPKERCASTSNRNFEGRQGYMARTHLVSPSMAAAAAVSGHFIDVSAH